MPETKNAPKDESDKIWITSKTRIRSEMRFKTYNLVSHLLLSYYALTMIVTSIFSETLSGTISYFSEINTSFAVLLFGTSLIVAGFKFEETARAHRDCYLRLQRLISRDLPNEQLLEQYHEILAGYPNHSDRDFDDFVIDHTLFRNKDLLNSDKVPINYTKLMVAAKYVRLALFWLFVIVLFLLPIGLLIIPFVSAIC